MDPEQEDVYDVPLCIFWSRDDTTRESAHVMDWLKGFPDDELSTDNVIDEKNIDFMGKYSFDDKNWYHWLHWPNIICPLYAYEVK